MKTIADDLPKTRDQDGELLMAQKSASKDAIEFVE